MISDVMLEALYRQPLLFLSTACSGLNHIATLLESASCPETICVILPEFSASYFL